MDHAFGGRGAARPRTGRPRRGFAALVALVVLLATTAVVGAGGGSVGAVGLPPLPPNVSAVPTGATELTITWDTEGSSQGGSPVTAVTFELYGSYGFIEDFGGGTSGTWVAYIPPLQDYSVVAYAINADGQYSEPAYASGTMPTAPAPPTGFTVVQPMNSWGDTVFSYTPSVGGGTYPVNGYQLRCTRPGNADYVSAVSVSDTTFGRFLPADPWSCTLRARSLSVLSAPTPAQSITVGPLPTPTGLTLTQWSGQALLDFARPAAGLVTSWDVETDPFSPGTDGYAESGTGDPLAISGVPEGVPTRYRVRAVRQTIGDRQAGPWSAWTNQLTIGPRPGAPTNVDVTSATGTIDVTWTPPTPNGSPAVTAYVLHFQFIDLAEFDVVLPATARFHHALAAAGSDWSVSIRARNVNGDGPAVVRYPVYTVDPPSPVRGLIAKDGPVPGQVEMSWLAPTYLPPAQTGYEGWYRVQATGPVALDRQVPGPSTLFTELPPGWYRATVTVLDVLNPGKGRSRWFAVGDQCDQTFTDVSGGQFCEPISWLVRSEIAGGFPNGTYRPADAVSRQAMSAFIYRASGSPRGPDPQCSAAAFPDVPQSHTFCGEIDWMVDEGITSGYADGQFKPTVAVSRQAMAAFLHRASEVVDPGVPSCGGVGVFPDVSASSPFCGYVKWLVDSGIAGGYPDGTFKPTNPVSRQAMAAFLYRWR